MDADEDSADPIFRERRRQFLTIAESWELWRHNSRDRRKLVEFIATWARPVLEQAGLPSSVGTFFRQPDGTYGTAVTWKQPLSLVHVAKAVDASQEAVTAAKALESIEKMARLYALFEAKLGNDSEAFAKLHEFFSSAFNLGSAHTHAVLAQDQGAYAWTGRNNALERADQQRRDREWKMAGEFAKQGITSRLGQARKIAEAYGFKDEAEIKREAERIRNRLRSQADPKRRVGGQKRTKKAAERGWGTPEPQS